MLHSPHPWCADIRIANMDLSAILKNLHIPPADISPLTISKPSGDHDCSVARVFQHIQVKLKSETWSEVAVILDLTGELFRVADSSWLLPGVPDSDLSSWFSHFVQSLICHAALPICETDSATLAPELYQDIPERACAVTAVLQALLLRLGHNPAPTSCTAKRCLTRVLAPCISVFAATHLQDQPWTSEASRKDAAALLDAVAQATGHSCFPDMMCGSSADDDAGLVRAVMDILKPQLTK